MPAMMEIESQLLTDDVTVLAPKGRLDMSSANTLKDAISAVVASGTSRIVIDCSAITFIDSIGLTAIISGLKAATALGGQVNIASPSEHVRFVLDLTSLNRVLVPYDSVADAVGAIAGRSGDN